MIVDHLSVGDIFHADSPNGAHLICLTTSVTETTIHARSVTNDQYMEFDRKTGAGMVTWRERKTPCTIYSTSPLPEDIHNIILEMDRKTRSAEASENWSAQDESKPWLNEEERRALLYVAKHHRPGEHEQGRPITND
jgi:hypothetical protein